MAIPKTQADHEERIRLMLLKAQTTTPDEAEMIMEQVEKLMLKYGIENLQSLIADKKTEEIGMVTIEYDGVYAKAWVHMAYAIIKALGDMQAIQVKTYKQGSYKQRGLGLKIVGYESDLKRAKTLVESLSLQCISALTIHMDKVNAYYNTPSEKYIERRSFISGFGHGASTRIGRTRRVVVQEAEVSVPGTALVLADRGTEVERVYDEMFTDRRKTRGMQIRVSAFEQGDTAGRQSRTGEAEVGSTRKAIK